MSKLEASDNEFLEFVLPFVGDTVDAFCSLFEAAEATKTFYGMCFRG